MSHTGGIWISSLYMPAFLSIENTEYSRILPIWEHKEWTIIPNVEDWRTTVLSNSLSRFDSQ